MCFIYNRKQIISPDHKVPDTHCYNFTDDKMKMFSFCGSSLLTGIKSRESFHARLQSRCVCICLLLFFVIFRIFVYSRKYLVFAVVAFCMCCLTKTACCTSLCYTLLILYFHVWIHIIKGICIFEQRRLWDLFTQTKITCTCMLCS